MIVVESVGALHRVIERGIECRKIFIDDMDRNGFLDGHLFHKPLQIRIMPHIL